MNTLPGVGGHTTPISSEWSQSCTPMPLCGQSNSRSSKPLHSTSSNQIEVGDSLKTKYWGMAPWNRVKYEFCYGYLRLYCQIHLLTLGFMLVYHSHNIHPTQQFCITPVSLVLKTVWQLVQPFPHSLMPMHSSCKQNIYRVNSDKLGDGSPSCRHTTCASSEPNESSQTVPHLPLTQSSSFPSRRDELPTSRMFPVSSSFVQATCTHQGVWSVCVHVCMYVCPCYNYLIQYFWKANTTMA